MLPVLRKFIISVGMGSLVPGGLFYLWSALVEVNNLGDFPVFVEFLVNVPVVMFLLPIVLLYLFVTILPLAFASILLLPAGFMTEYFWSRSSGDSFIPGLSFWGFVANVILWSVVTSLFMFVNWITDHFKVKGRQNSA